MKSIILILTAITALSIAGCVYAPDGYGVKTGSSYPQYEKWWK